MCFYYAVVSGGNGGELTAAEMTMVIVPRYKKADGKSRENGRFPIVLLVVEGDFDVFFFGIKP